MNGRQLGALLFVTLGSVCACSATGDGAGDKPSRTQSGPGPVPMINGKAGSSAGSAGQPGNDFGNPTAGAIGTDVMPVGGAGSDLCEVVQLTANPSTPDMLIVLDRSGSMGEEMRWQPSADAVRMITQQLDAQIRFGLALFPDPALTGQNGGNIDITPCLTAADPVTCLNDLLQMAGLGDACSPGKIVVPVGDNAAAAIGTTLDMTLPAGGTPTPDTLKAVIDEFAPIINDPDFVPNPKFVLLVTDGQPTCPNGGGSNTTEPDITASNQAIEALTMRGVRTYVIGYNTTGPGNEMLASVLDGFAQRGGTGDTMHRPVEDQQSLMAELQDIAGAAVSCTFVLDEAPPQPDYVLVKVDGVQVNLDDPDGWHLVDGRTVELTGSTCDKLQSDGEHLVEAEVRCEVVVPL